MIEDLRLGFTTFRLGVGFLPCPVGILFRLLISTWHEIPHAVLLCLIRIINARTDIHSKAVSDAKEVSNEMLLECSGLSRDETVWETLPARVKVAALFPIAS